MNAREMMRNSPLVASALAILVAVVLLVWTVVRAVQVEPVLAAAPPRFAALDSVGQQRATPPIDVRSVVELNAFSPERTAPARRYRLSGWDEPAASAAAPPPQPIVLGTVYSTPEQSFAIAKVGDGRPTVVRAGDILAGYSVRSIERGHVVFTSQTGERLEIRSNRQD